MPQEVLCHSPFVYPVSLTGIQRRTWLVFIVCWTQKLSSLISPEIKLEINLSASLLLSFCVSSAAAWRCRWSQADGMSLFPKYPQVNWQGRIYPPVPPFLFSPVLLGGKLHLRHAYPFAYAPTAESKPQSSQPPVPCGPLKL